MKPQMPPLARIEGVPRYFGIGRIVHVDKENTVSFSELIENLVSSDMIFIGEVHDNPEHHLIEVQILQALLARRFSRTVAMEFFAKPRQAAVDRYLSGKSAEPEFLKDVDWKHQWSFDYSFYRPIILEIKENRGRILAINAPNDLVRKVAGSGLKSLSPDERAQLAENIDLSSKRHREYLAEIFKCHTHNQVKNFDNFYAAQCVWEDTMAENIAKYRKKTGNKLIVLTGNGHIINKFGIPDRTFRRVPVKIITIVLLPLGTDMQTIRRGMADYVWLTGNCARIRSVFRPGHSKKK